MASMSDEARVKYLKRVKNLAEADEPREWQILTLMTTGQLGAGLCDVLIQEDKNDAPWVNRKELSVHSQELRTVPLEFGGLFIGLERLQLDNNLLTSLPDTLKNCVKLESISLVRNKLLSVPHVLFEMPWLKELFLGRNSLYTLPAQVENWKKMKKLGIDHNKLCMLPPSMRAMHDFQILVTGNPLAPTGAASGSDWVMLRELAKYLEPMGLFGGLPDVTTHVTLVDDMRAKMSNVCSLLGDVTLESQSCRERSSLALIRARSAGLWREIRARCPAVATREDETIDPIMFTPSPLNVTVSLGDIVAPMALSQITSYLHAGVAPAVAGAALTDLLAAAQRFELVELAIKLERDRDGSREVTIAEAACTQRLLDDMGRARTEGVMSNFADVVIIADGERFLAHRAILATRSEHFANMLGSGMAESEATEIAVTTDRESFADFMHYLYTDELRTTAENAFSLLVLADMLQEETLRCRMLLFCLKGVQPLNAIALFLIAEQFNLTLLRMQALLVILHNFTELRSTASFKRLPANVVQDLRAKRELLLGNLKKKRTPKEAQEKAQLKQKMRNEKKRAKEEKRKGKSPEKAPAKAAAGAGAGAAGSNSDSDIDSD